MLSCAQLNPTCQSQDPFTWHSRALQSCLGRINSPLLIPRQTVLTLSDSFHPRDWPVCGAEWRLHQLSMNACENKSRQQH